MDAEPSVNNTPEQPRAQETAKQLIRHIKHHGRKRVAAEDKIRIIMEGLRGEESVADLCRREGLSKCVYYDWMKAFLEAGKKRLLGDHLREANTSEVRELRDENDELKATVAELTLENRRLKKSRPEE
jgi:transposase